MTFQTSETYRKELILYSLSKKKKLIFYFFHLLGPFNFFLFTIYDLVVLGFTLGGINTTNIWWLALPPQFSLLLLPPISDNLNCFSQSLSSFRNHHRKPVISPIYYSDGHITRIGKFSSHCLHDVCRLVLASICRI